MKGSSYDFVLRESRDLTQYFNWCKLLHDIKILQFSSD